MRAGRLTFLLLLGGAALLSACSVSAGTSFSSGSRETYSTSEECMESAALSLSRTCTSFENGVWVAQDFGDPFQDSGVPGGGAFAGFLVIALLWAITPAIIGAVMASQRQQSVGLAILICLVLGWIGLVIVAVLFKPEVAGAARNVIDRANEPIARPPIPPPPPAAAPKTRTVEERLRELNSLQEGGLITAAEHTRRKEAILDEL